MRTLTNRIRAFPNENCNKTNLTYIWVLSTCVQLQRILKVYLTVVTVVQVHGSVYSFIKSISPSNPRTVKVVAQLVLQCGLVELSAIHWRTHGSHPKMLLQHWAISTDGLNMSLQIVQVRLEVTCSLNVASSLLCWSPILLLISRQRSETRATFSSTASSPSISPRTEGNKAKRTRKALPREGELGNLPLKVCCF